MPLDLGKQVGPLPLGAWFAVVAGGVGIALYARQNQSAPGPAESNVARNTSGDAGVGYGTNTFVAATSVQPAQQPGPATNEEWAVNAINYLIGQGYDANVADSAVRKYLESTRLNGQEYALIRFALVKLGSPPVPLPIPPDAPSPPSGGGTPPPVTPPSAPPPAPSPVPSSAPALRYVVVRPWPSKYSTLSGIAYIFYGRQDAWHDIYNANRKGYTRPDGSPGFISNPNYLRSGDVLWVPGVGGPIR